MALELTVFETAPRAGGHIVTEVTAEGFLVEGGPDCFVSQKPWGVRLTAELGLQLESTGPVSTTFVLSGGRLHPLPEGTMLMVPTKFLPLARSRLLTWPGKLRMGLDLVLPRGGVGDESLGAFVTRRLGAEALEKIAEPLVAGVHAGDPDRLSLLSTFPRFKAMETDHRSLILAMVRARQARSRAERARAAGAQRPPSAFVTVAGGLGRLVEGSGGHPASRQPAAGDPGDRARAAPGRGYRLRAYRARRGAALEADAVVLATPAHEAAGLVRGLNDDLSGELAGVEAVSAATVTIGLRRGDVAHPLDGFGLVIPRREQRRIMGVTWSSVQVSRPGAGGHRCSCGCSWAASKARPCWPWTTRPWWRWSWPSSREILGVRGRRPVTRLYPLGAGDAPVQRGPRGASGAHRGLPRPDPGPGPGRRLLPRYRHPRLHSQGPSGGGGRGASSAAVPPAG